VGTSIVDFGLQSIVLIAFMIIFRYHFFGWNVLLLPLAFVGLVLFTTTVSIWVSALNVRYRDTQHLLNLILLAWFWLTPIVYPAGLLQDKLGALGFKVYLVLNPVGDIVMAFQRALYAQVQPAGAASPVLASLSVGQLALVMVWVIVLSTLLLLAAWRSFFRLSGDFAEDL
jgi:ABC-2 type transport system permease protein